MQEKLFFLKDLQHLLILIYWKYVPYHLKLHLPFVFLSFTHGGLGLDSHSCSCMPANRKRLDNVDCIK